MRPTIIVNDIFVDAADDHVSRIHLAFQARSQEGVDAFQWLALETAGRLNAAPGLRRYHERYHAAFVLDPEGNNIEGLCDAPYPRSADSVGVEKTR